MPRQLLRLKAFTIVELLVVMAVSAILFSMAYLALRVVTQQQHTATQKLAQLRQTNTLQWLLARDFRRAKMVYQYKGTLVCQLSTQLVTYELLDSTLLRRQAAVVDTFPLPIMRYQFLHNGAWQKIENGLVDEASFTLRYGPDTVVVQARAWYAAEVLNLASNEAVLRP